MSIRSGDIRDKILSTSPYVHVTHHQSTALRSLSVDYDQWPCDHHARRDSCWPLVPFDRQTQPGEDLSSGVLYSDVGKARI